MRGYRTVGRRGNIKNDFREVFLGKKKKQHVNTYVDKELRGFLPVIVVEASATDRQRKPSAKVTRKCAKHLGQ